MAPNILKSFLAVSALHLGLIAAPATAQQASVSVDQKQIERGRYLVKVTGCNDCHTPGYAMSGGKVPEAQWLVGDKLGWRGPWGTTYPVNLRLYMSGIGEAQWVKTAKTKEMRPPMPWFALRDMTDQDLKAIYHFVKSLGPSGAAAPTFVAPDKQPQGPFVQFPAPPKN